MLVMAALLFLSLACISTSLIAPNQTATAPAAQTSICKIPDLTGMEQQTAMKNLAALGLTPVKTLDYSDTIPADSVITTDPPPGTTLDTCQSNVTIVISMGPSQNAATPAPPSAQGTEMLPTFGPTPDMSAALDKPMYNTFYQEGFNPLNNGLDPAWKVKINPGGSMSTKDGTLVVTGTILAQVGDPSWQDYRITFNSISGSGYSFVAFFHVQSDTSNSMAMSCQSKAASASIGSALHCEWFRIVNQAQTKISGDFPAEVCASICTIMIEAIGNNYRFVFNDVEQFKFSDDTYTNGGVGFYVSSTTQPWTLASFDVSHPPQPASPGDILFRDDFKTSTWDTGQYDDQFATYERTMVDGKYRWYAKAKRQSYQFAAGVYPFCGCKSDQRA
jgi:hypothetical protein